MSNALIPCIRLPAETVGGLYVSACANFPQRIFIRSAAGFNVTYEESLRTVGEIVAKMNQLGLKKGDHLVFYLDEPIPMVHLICACAIKGVIFTPLSPIFSPAYLESLVQRLGARFVYSTAATAAALRKLGFHTLYFSENPIGKTKMGWFSSQAEMPIEKAWDVVRATEELTGGDIYMIQPTSGSTGAPKLVIRTHASPLRYARYVGAVLNREGRHERFLMTASLTHALGNHMLATALATAAELCIPSQIDAETDLSEVVALDPTVLPTTPRVIRSFCKQHKEKTGDAQLEQRVFGPSAQFLLTAGSVPDADLLRKVARHGLDIIEFYGSSETSLISLTERGLWREGFAGRILPDVGVQIADDGEILIKSPGQMVRYWGETAATDAVYDECGNYHTGDFGTTDGDYLKILGRKKDVFNTFEGSNIYPERIEQMLESIEGIRQAVLLSDHRSELTALVVVEPPTETTGENEYKRLSEHILQINMRLEKIERIANFHILREAFPEDLYSQTASGKIRRNRKALHNVFGDVLTNRRGVAVRKFTDTLDITEVDL